MRGILQKNSNIPGISLPFVGVFFIFSREECCEESRSDNVSLFFNVAGNPLRDIIDPT
jgi:hypothetical protein